MACPYIASDYLKAVAIEEFVGIEECALSTILGRRHWTGSEVYNFDKFLTIAKETFAKLHNVNPVEIAPSGVGFPCPTDSIVKVESVNVKSHFVPDRSCHNGHFIKKKPLESGHISTGK